MYPAWIIHNLTIEQNMIMSNNDINNFIQSSALVRALTKLLQQFHMQWLYNDCYDCMFVSVLAFRQTFHPQ